ncbi:MAG: hypothetical protein QXZ14_12055 [Candidatus Jordarchaeales archaeon]
MARVSVEEAASKLRSEILTIKGVWAVSHVGNTIIVYIESPEIARYVPKTYLGYPVQVKITGPVMAL